MKRPARWAEFDSALRSNKIVRRSAARWRPAHSALELAVFARPWAYATLLHEGIPVPHHRPGRRGGGTLLSPHADCTTRKMPAPIFPPGQPVREQGPRFAFYGLAAVLKKPVLAFEIWAMTNHTRMHWLVWEAQFGDFFQRCAGVVDQFITSGEHKWRPPVWSDHAAAARLRRPGSGSTLPRVLETLPAVERRAQHQVCVAFLQPAQG